MQQLHLTPPFCHAGVESPICEIYKTRSPAMPGQHYTVLAGLRVTLKYGLNGTKLTADLTASVAGRLYPVSCLTVCRRHMGHSSEWWG